MSKIKVKSVDQISRKTVSYAECQMMILSIWRPGARKPGFTAGLHSKLLAYDKRLRNTCTFCAVQVFYLTKSCLTVFR